MQKRLTEQGLKYLEAGQFDKASQILSLLINRFPTNAEAHHMLGIIELEKGNFTEAYILVNTALDIDETNSVFYNTMGNIELHRKDIVAAEQAFLRAIKFKPDKIEYQFNIANFYLSQSKYAEAIDHYYEILRSNPTHYLSIRGITIAYLLSGETDIALEHANEWVAQYKDYDEPHYYQGLCQYSLNNISDALAAYDVGLSIVPTNHEILAAIGACYRALGNFNIAETYIHNSLSLEPHNPAALYHLACIHFDKGEIETAQKIFRNANLLNPTYADPLCGLGNIELAYGHNDTALNYFSLAVQAEPSNKTAKLLSATTLLRQQMFGVGWSKYISTLATNNLLRKIPAWDKNKLSDNDTLLVWTHSENAELSYQIMFSSVFFELQQEAQNVIILCDPNFGKLLRKQYPNWRFVSKIVLDDLESNKFQISHQISLSELCGHYRNHADDFLKAQTRSRLIADPSRTQYYKDKYKLLFAGKITIGISWRSSSSDFKHIIDFVKSTNLNAWTNLLNKEHCQFISLQVGDVADELLQINQTLANKIYIDQDVQLENTIDICELSAQIASLDLVISVDNFVAHLAGSLGVSVYALISRPSEWYWFKDLPNALWYAKMQLLQQAKTHDWSKPLEQLNTIL